MSKQYIATFGANHEHEGYYILMKANSYMDAVEFMETTYQGKYCMVYGLEQWIEWAETARKNGFMIERQLTEINLTNKGE
ncbi:MAG: hypothetical protein ACRCX2_30070 [Paraclostridium sp.]